MRNNIMLDLSIRFKCINNVEIIVIDLWIKRGFNGVFYLYLKNFFNEIVNVYFLFG